MRAKPRDLAFLLVLDLAADDVVDDGRVLVEAVLAELAGDLL